MTNEVLVQPHVNLDIYAKILLIKCSLQSCVELQGLGGVNQYFAGTSLFALTIEEEFKVLHKFNEKEIEIKYSV